MIDGNPEPDQESLETHISVLLKRLVERRVSQHLVLGDVLVKDQTEDGQTGVDSRVPEHQESVVDGDGDEVEYAAENHLDDGNDEPAVNDEVRQSRGALVGVPAVPEHEVAQVAELRNREVTRERGLHSLLPLDSDSDVGALDHPDVVAPVPDAADPSLGVFLEILRDL